jgi:hypothetical protein
VEREHWKVLLRYHFALSTLTIFLASQKGLGYTKASGRSDLCQKISSVIFNSSGIRTSEEKTSFQSSWLCVSKNQKFSDI